MAIDNIFDVTQALIHGALSGGSIKAIKDMYRDGEIDGKKRLYHNAPSKAINSIKEQGLLAERASDSNNLTMSTLGKRFKENGLDVNELKGKTYLSKGPFYADSIGVSRFLHKGDFGKTLKATIPNGDYNNLKIVRNPELLGAKDKEKYLKLVAKYKKKGDLNPYEKFSYKMNYDDMVDGMITVDGDISPKYFGNKFNLSDMGAHLKNNPSKAFELIGNSALIGLNLGIGASALMRKNASEFDKFEKIAKTNIPYAYSNHSAPDINEKESIREYLNHIGLQDSDMANQLNDLELVKSMPGVSLFKDKDGAYKKWLDDYEPERLHNLSDTEYLNSEDYAKYKKITDKEPHERFYSLKDSHLGKSIGVGAGLLATPLLLKASSKNLKGAKKFRVPLSAATIGGAIGSQVDRVIDSKNIKSVKEETLKKMNKEMGSNYGNYNEAIIPYNSKEVRDIYNNADYIPGNIKDKYKEACEVVDIAFEKRASRAWKRNLHNIGKESLDRLVSSKVLNRDKELAGLSRGTNNIMKKMNIKQTRKTKDMARNTYKFSDKKSRENLEAIGGINALNKTFLPHGYSAIKQSSNSRPIVNIPKGKSHGSGFLEKTIKGYGIDAPKVDKKDRKWQNEILRRHEVDEIRSSGKALKNLHQEANFVKTRVGSHLHPDVILRENANKNVAPESVKNYFDELRGPKLFGENTALGNAAGKDDIHRMGYLDKKLSRKAEKGVVDLNSKYLKSQGFK